MRPIVQVSLDVTSIPEALSTADLAVRAGVDWLEAGTPLLLAEGCHALRSLRDRFPLVPIVADVKIMDGGYLETEMVAKAGATHVVVMARAHSDTIRLVVEAGRDLGVKVMGDDLACTNAAEAARRLEDLGCDYVVHHVGYDQRRSAALGGRPISSPLDRLREVVSAVRIPVQAVGGLSREESVRTLDHGAKLVVIGAPLVIDATEFRAADGEVEATLRAICAAVHGATLPVGDPGQGDEDS